MIYLNEKDLRLVISMKEMVDAIDLAYDIYHSGDFAMPTRIQIIDQENTFLVMPSVIKEAIGTKLVTLFPNNTSLPRLHSIMILTSSETGEVKAMLDGTFLTGFRTGAVGGSAVRHLAKEKPQKLAIIGTGVQGFYQAIAACTERTITEIKLYNRTETKLSGFIEKLKDEIDEQIEIIACSSREEAIKDADIIITATNSKTPVLPESPQLLKNKLIIGIGSFQPTMREFPNILYQIASHIFIDTKDAMKESGDICTPFEKHWIKEQTVQTMASFLASGKKIKREQGKSIVFKSTGMGLFDVVVANIIYKKAIELNIGQRLYT